MNFFRRFLRAYRNAGLAIAYDPMADTPESWDQEDAINLCNFLGSQTGRKLKVRLLNYVVRCALQATELVKNVDYHCGLAKGVKLGVSALQEHALLASHPRSDDTPEDQTQPSAAADFALL